MELLEHMCKFQMGNAFNHTVRNSILRQISLWEKEGSRLFLPRGNSILRQTFLWEKKGGRFSYGEKKGSRLLFIQARMRPKKDNFKTRYVFILGLGFRLNARGKKCRSQHITQTYQIKHAYIKTNYPLWTIYMISPVQPKSHLSCIIYTKYN